MSTTEGDDESADPFDRAVAWGLSHGVAMLSLGGVGAYALGRLCYVAFFSSFGISPDEVGIDQARSVEAAGLLLVAACVAVASMRASNAATDSARPGWKSIVSMGIASLAFQVPAIIIFSRAAVLGDSMAITFAALVAVVLGLVFVHAAVRGGYSAPGEGVEEDLPGKHALHRFLSKFSALQVLVSALLVVGSGSVVAAWQFGIHAAYSGSFNAPPFSAIRIDSVCLTPVTGALPAPIKRHKPYARLGSAAGVLVLYDTEAKTALRIPETSVVMVTSRNVDGKPTCD